MGTYLAKLRNLPTVSYGVAKVDELYGLASVNFKKTDSKYYTIGQINGVIPHCDFANIDVLRSFTIDSTNESQFISHLFNLFALDIHMLQRDRGYVNLQFEFNTKNGYFDMAPLYDYSNCSPRVGAAGLNVSSRIVKLDDLGIYSLLKKYPEFRECLEFCLEQDMKDIWNQICLDYHFKQDCLAYEQIENYYETKDESQKQYIKQMITDSKR